MQESDKSSLNLWRKLIPTKGCRATGIIIIIIIITNFMAYGNRRFNAAFTRTLQ